MGFLIPRKTVFILKQDLAPPLIFWINEENTIVAFFSFSTFLQFEVAHVIENLPHGRKRYVSPTKAIPWLLIIWYKIYNKARNHLICIHSQVKHLVNNKSLFKQLIICVVVSNPLYDKHLLRQWNCWSLRCSWSIACRRCSNYIFILDLTHGFNEMGKDNFKM